MTAGVDKRTRVTRLVTGNWRNFSRFDVKLAPRAFLVGPNASGKSNFLDILKFLRDGASPVGGGLQEAVRRRGGISALRCLAARGEPDIALRVSLGNGSEEEWTRELRLTADRRRTPRVQQEGVLHGSRCLLDRPDITPGSWSLPCAIGVPTSPPADRKVSGAAWRA